MKTHRQFVAILAITVLLLTLVTAPPLASLPSAAHTASNLDVPFATPTRTPYPTSTATMTPILGCDSWSEQAAYPIPIRANAIASFGSYIYSFGGMTLNGVATSAAYKFDGTSWTAITSLPISTTAVAASDGAYIYIFTNSNIFYRYDPISNTYATLASPFSFIEPQSALYLNNEIYVIGLYEYENPPPIVMDVYTINSNQWHTGTNYPDSSAFALTVALNGYLYADSGLTYRYDTTTNLWEDNAIANPYIAVQTAASGTLNGEWIIAGGFYGPSTYIWNPQANNWRRMADLPSTQYVSVGATLDNAFYIVGGTIANNQPTDATWRFTNNCPSPTPSATATGTPATATPSPAPTCDVWQEQPAYPVAVARNAVVTLNGYLYSFGGSSDMGDIYTFKYDGATWTQLHAAPMLFNSANAVTDGNYIYIIQPGNSGGNAAFYRYDPGVDSYSPLAGPPITSTGRAAYLDGKIYVANYVSDNNNTSPVQVYTISTGTWGQVARYPRGEASAMIALDGYIYAIGSLTFGGNKTYRYDPAFNNWSDSAIADAPIVVGRPISDIFKGEWLLADGWGVQSWNPATNSWRILSPPLITHGNRGGATLGNAFYAIGGEDISHQAYGTNDNQRYTTSCQPTPQPTPTLCATPFQDISGNVFYGAIAYLYCNGAVNGTDATHYSPAATSTRGQFARVVVKAFGMPLTTPAGGQSFTDVPPGYFAYNYIESGLAMGILSGYAADQCAAADAIFPCYLPNRPITRAELTKLVVKAAGYALTTPASPHFVDVPPSYFAYSYIETAYAHNVIRGVDSSHFAPARSIRRDEMAQVVYKGYITPLSPAP